MKNIFKKKSFWIITVILIIVIFIVGYNFFKNDSDIEYTTEEAVRGNLVQTVTATGAVDSAQDIDLSFRAGGRVVYMAVDEGDMVKAGQVLASVDSASLSAQIAQYQASLNSAKADLERIKAGSSGEQIKISEEKVSKAQNDLDSLKNKRNNELQALREKNINSLNNASFTMVVALDKVYNYLVAEDKTTYLQVNNSALDNIVESDYYKMKNRVDEAQQYIESANQSKISDSIIESSTKVIDIMSELNSFLDNSFALANSIIINASYTQTTKDSIKSDISTQQSANNTTLNSIQTAKSNLVASIDSYNSSIQSAENSLAIAQAELNLTKAGPRSFEISSAEAKVGQAQAQLNSALANLDDYSIITPIDGIITAVNYSLGEQAVASQVVIKMLSTDKYEINVDIPESDITKIEVGDKTIIELDAFGSDHFFEGTVAFIDPAQTVIQDVIYYRTKVNIDTNSFADRIKPGMTADVTITTIEKDDILYIPQRAVKIREAVLGEVPEKYVEILLADGSVEERKVEIGIRGDGGLVEVLSGVSAGDNVVTFKKDNK